MGKTIKRMEEEKQKVMPVKGSFHPADDAMMITKDF